MSYVHRIFSLSVFFLVPWSKFVFWVVRNLLWIRFYSLLQSKSWYCQKICWQPVQINHYLIYRWFRLHANKSIPLLFSTLMHKILIYLHIKHLLKSSTCFEHYSARLQEVYSHNCIYAASGIWRYQRLHIYNCDVDLLKTSRVMLETCRGI